MRTLVLGGARSGKSAWAERLLADPGPGAAAPVHYLATARPRPGEAGFDADFAARIAAHRARRPAHWVTVPAADAPAALAGLADRDPAPPALLDDAGTWLTGVLDEGRLWEAPRGCTAAAADRLLAAVAAWPGPAELVLVSPETGLGVIPGHRSGRLFRDELGVLNARLAEVCDRVVLVVAGLPLALKGALPSSP